MAVPASARTLASLQADGYLVERVLSVDGDFRGCDATHPIHFVGGADFQCQARSFTYLRQPLAFVLRNPATLDTVLLIGGAEYQGRLEGLPSLGRRIDAGTGPLLEQPGPAIIRLAPDEPAVPTHSVIPITGIDQPMPPGHDDGTPQPR